MSAERHFAHGKILISGEYAVLKGAKALAIPTIMGQELSVNSRDKDIYWESLDHYGKKWFEAKFDLQLNILDSWDVDRAQFIQNLLKVSHQKSGRKVEPIHFCSFLEFPSNWGLGSSSTLTYLLSKFYKIDAFELFFATQNGSGYDIACAGSKHPLVYKLVEQRPSWEDTMLNPVFQEARFIYLGNKQDSRKEVTKFNQMAISVAEINKVSQLTDAFTKVKYTADLQDLMRVHETLLAGILQRPSVASSLFPQFNGAIKSLGAWGGDYVMALGEDTDVYFKELGYTQVLSYQDLFGTLDR